MKCNKPPANFEDDDEIDDFARPSIRRIVSAATAPPLHIAVALSKSLWISREPAATGFEFAVRSPVTTPDRRVKLMVLLTERPLPADAIRGGLGLGSAIYKYLHRWRAQGLIRRDGSDEYAITEKGRAFLQANSGVTDRARDGVAA